MRFFKFAPILTLFLIPVLAYTSAGRGLWGDTLQNNTGGSLLAVPGVGTTLDSDTLTATLQNKTLVTPKVNTINDTSGVAMLTRAGGATILHKSDGGTAILADNYLLEDNNGYHRVDWNAGQLIDSTNVMAFDWQARLLKNTSAASVLDFSGSGPKFPQLTSNGPLVTSGGTGAVSVGSASGILDGIGSTRGSVLYRGVSGWAALTPGTSGYALISNGPGADPTYQAVAGGGGGSTTNAVTQTSHGFSVGNWLYYTGSAYALAKAAADTTSEVLGVVSTVTDANHFTISMVGYVSGLSGLTAGTTYYLSDSSAGAVTSTAPVAVGHINKPVLVADTTTSGYAIHSRGFAVGGSALSGSLVFSKYTSGTATWNPGKTECVNVRAAGGGGGGAKPNGNSCGGGGASGGGGGGSCTPNTILCVTAQNYTLSVGTGGAGGTSGGSQTGADGADGNDTTITDAGSVVVFRARGAKHGTQGAGPTSGGLGGAGDSAGGAGGNGNGTSSGGASGFAGGNAGFGFLFSGGTPGGSGGGGVGGGSGGASCFANGGNGGTFGSGLNGTVGTLGSGGGGGGGGCSVPSSDGASGGAGAIEIYGQ